MNIKIENKIMAITLAIMMISAIAMVLTTSAGATAPPSLPHTFWGTVTIDGELAPDGTIVSAKVNNIVHAYTIVNSGYYSFNVQEDKHITSGDKLYLHVDDVCTGEIHTFSPGATPTRIDLSMVGLIKDQQANSQQADNRPEESKPRIPGFGLAATTLALLGAALLFKKNKN